MGLYKSFCVLMDFNGSFLVLICPYSSSRILRIPHGFFGALFVFLDFNGSVWVRISPYLSL